MGKGPVLRLKPVKPGARKPGSRFVTNTTDSAHSSRDARAIYAQRVQDCRDKRETMFSGQNERHSGLAAKA